MVAPKTGTTTGGSGGSKMSAPSDRAHSDPAYAFLPYYLIPKEGPAVTQKPYSFTFYTASWYRKSPYWQRTVEAGSFYVELAAFIAMVRSCNN